MLCKELYALLSEQSVTPDSPAAQEAQVHIATCPRCRANFSLLSGEVANDEACATYIEMLPIYLDRQIVGDDVAHEYPYLWEHFQQCSRCYAIYAELSESLYLLETQQLSVPVLVSHPDLAFIWRDHPKPAAWTIHHVRDLKGYLQSTITISSSYITSILLPPHPAVGLRSENLVLNARDSFPLVDDLLGEDAELLINIEVIKDNTLPEAESWQLQILLLSTNSLRQVEVIVACQGSTRTALLDGQGRAYFANIPPEWLVAAKQGNRSEDLIITLREINADL